MNKTDQNMIVQHLYNQIMKINIDMKDYYYFKNVERTFMDDTP